MIPAPLGSLAFVTLVGRGFWIVARKAEIAWRGWFVSAIVLGFAVLPSRALDPAKSIYQFNVQSWTRQSGLPADKINAVAQTGDGFIWLGTQNGLVRFDGVEFMAVPITLNEARGQDIKNLVVANDGALLFAVSGGGFGKFDGRTFSVVDDPQWPADIRGMAILQAGDGAVWMGAATHWGRWPGKPAGSVFEPATSNVLVLAAGPSGRVWMGTAERGLFYWADEKLMPFPDEALKKENIFSVAEDRNGDVWVGTGFGLRHYNARFELVENHFPTSQITALLIDRHGILWIGTHRTGLIRYVDGVFTALSKSDGLGSDYVSSLFEDEEGSLWIGTQGGLSQLTDLKFPIVTEKEGLAPGAGITVAGSPKGGVWISLSTGATYLAGKAPAVTAVRSILPNTYGRRIFVARNGEIYFGDGEKRIAVVTEEGAVLRRLEAPSWPEAFAEDARGVLIGVGSRLMREIGGELVPYEFADGKNPEWNWINNLAVGRDDAIWVASSWGIFRVKDGASTQWSTHHGLSANRIQFIFEDVDGAVWAGMSTGLARIKNGQVRNVRLQDGLYNDKIFAIMPDDHGYFWIASGHGYFRVARQSLNDFADGRSGEVTCEPFDGLESVKFSDRFEEGYSVCKTPDGRIWFPNPRGVVMIDPVNYAINRTPPHVYVERAQANGRSLLLDGPAALEVGEENVDFVFAALSYIAPKKMQVRYQLEGVDRGWVEAGTRRSASYNNLRPGRYAFRVQAANADGIWNTKGAAFSFELPPPFYQTGWFYSLCGFAGVVAVLGGYRWKLRHMQRVQERLRTENDVLETKVGDRTRELADSLSLLKATLDSTPDGVLAINLEGKIVSHNAHFVTMWGASPNALATDAALIAFTATKVKAPTKFLARIREIHASPEVDAFDVFEMIDGRTIERYCRPQRIDGKCVGIVINFRDITARRRAEAQLVQVHQQLLDTSRQAGMAEVATSVLHNVGNVLNSVNVSATVVMDRVRGSKVNFVPKLSALLQEHAQDLARFLTTDPKGQKIPSYLENLSKQLVTEQKSVVDELEQLRKNVEHIKEIVAMQQNYARVSGVAETVGVAELVDDVVQMNADALTRHDVELVRDYQVQPRITTERHKVLQVLINLVRNAKHACDAAERPDKKIVMRIVQDGRRVRISVIDNGIGILPENLTRIFAHGFTTKKEGHGFGLHSGALVAKELGGSLQAHSEGVGRGAAFTLELPLGAAEETRVGGADGFENGSSHPHAVVAHGDRAGGAAVAAK